MQELFKQYQPQLLKLANNSFGRRFLGINDIEARDKKILALGPNAYVIGAGVGKYKAVFRCYPIFAKRLSFALTAVDLVKNPPTLNLDLYQGLPTYQGLLNYAGLLNDRRFPFILMATDTIYATAAGDGSTTKFNASWATARANDATSAGTGAGTLSSDLINQDGGYYVYRLFTPFDTSSLGAGSTVTAATYSIMPSAVTANNGAWNVVETTQASATALAVSDHANFNTTRLKTTDTSSFSAESYTDFALNASGLAVINVTGATKIAGRVDKDIDNIAPGGPPQYNNITLYASDTAGTTKDPKLAVTYTAGSSGILFVL